MKIDREAIWAAVSRAIEEQALTEFSGGRTVFPPGETFTSIAGGGHGIFTGSTRPQRDALVDRIVQSIELEARAEEITKTGDEA